MKNKRFFTLLASIISLTKHIDVLVKKTPLFIYLIICCSSIYSQTTKEEFLSDIKYASGVYQPYIYTNSELTQAPEGYKPFYISHYGRHGSRYLEPAESYTVVSDILYKAHVDKKLSTFGESLFERIRLFALDAEARYGDVTPLGIKEHKEIAQRMFQNFPEIFNPNNQKKCYVYSRSTVVPRCILSMTANNESLKELNPDIIIERNATKRDTYLNNSYKVPYRDSINAVSKNFIQNNFDFGTYFVKVFSDTVYANKLVTDKADFISKLYYLVADIQDVNHLNISMTDVFSKDELFILWQSSNIKLYMVFTSKAAVDSSKKLLKNILDCADNAIKNNNISADLRFGHDSYIAPLLTLMDVKGTNIKENDPNKIYKAWCDFKVTPMAVNLQLIFYKNEKEGEVIVKLLHNEKEVEIPVKTNIFPYYSWTDIKEYYFKKLIN